MPDASKETGFRLEIRRTLKAPRERVFRAWTEPEELKKWWGPQGMDCTEAEIDLRKGGRYRYVILDPEGKNHIVGGTFEEIAPPERLVFTWAWEDHPEIGGVEMRVTVNFIEKGAETKLVLTQEKLPTEKARDEHSWGWNSTLDCLAELLR